MAPEGTWLSAERARKKKIQREWRKGDLKNRFWRANDSNFGYKMLLQMGWTEGKGLGANEDGRVDYVQVDQKCDNAGVGLQQKDNSLNWLENAKGFDDVLKALNQAYGNQTNSADVRSGKPSSAGPTSQSQPTKKKRKRNKKDRDSLLKKRQKHREETSAEKETSSRKSPAAQVADSSSISSTDATTSSTSKGKHRYAKRVQAKDVSRYSSADMASIFGGLPHSTVDHTVSLSNKKVKRDSTKRNQVNSDKVKERNNLADETTKHEDKEVNLEATRKNSGKSKKNQRKERKRSKHSQETQTNSSRRVSKKKGTKRRKKDGEAIAENGLGWTNWESLAGNSLSKEEKAKFLKLMGARKSKKGQKSKDVPTRPVISRDEVSTNETRQFTRQALQPKPRVKKVGNLTFVSAGNAFSAEKAKANTTVNDELENQYLTAVQGKAAWQAHQGLGFKRKGELDVDNISSTKLCYSDEE